MRTAVEIAEGVRHGQLSAVEVLKDTLDRIAARNGPVNAFVHLDPTAAFEAAKGIDALVSAGRDPGPLAGVPIGIKDNDPVRAMPTRQGSLLLADGPAEPEDSVHVARLRAAGALIIGKLAMSEFGLDGVTHSLAHGTCRNPWNLERTPSGSSGGSSAAVSAGLVPIGTGSDALGSIRCPAGFTGTVGLKPSLGRVPRRDGFRDTATFGALTATVGDTARYLDVVSGPDDHDRMSLPAIGRIHETAAETLDVAGLHAVYSADLGFAPVTDEVAAICEDAARALCAVAGLVLMPYGFVCTNAYMAWNALASRPLRAQFERSGWLPAHADQISPGPRRFIDRFGAMSLTQELEHHEVCKRLEREVAGFFAAHQILITPTACCEAYAAEGPLPEVIEGRDASHTNAEPYTTIGSICWNPSISVPAGMTRSGLPVGLLINGPRHRDDVVLRIARLWELGRPWLRTAPGYG